MGGGGLIKRRGDRLINKKPMYSHPLTTPLKSNGEVSGSGGGGGGGGVLLMNKNQHTASSISSSSVLTVNGQKPFMCLILKKET